MALPAQAPTVIPKSRTTVIGGESFTRQTLTLDIQAQGLSDLRWLMQNLAANDTAEQIRLHNPPTAVVVDGKPAREFDDVRRKIVVLYGMRLAVAAMRVVESILRENIQRATLVKTGRLRDVTGSWRWRFNNQVVTSASNLRGFTRGDVLILEPYSVPHATRVNTLVTRRRMFTKKGAKGAPKQPIGFMRATAERVRVRPEFAQFSVTVGYTKEFMVPGEVSRKQGTAALFIQLKRR